MIANLLWWLIAVIVGATPRRLWSRFPSVPFERAALAAGVFAISPLAFFSFLFLTPIGLLATYLVVSGTLRAVAAMVDDARGDPIVSAVHWAATSMAAANTRERRQIARERREGVETPDQLATGEWAGLDA